MKELKKYHGIFPPIITPIDEKENVDEEGLRKLIDHCIDHGIHGMFIAGTNGETMAITQKERDRAIAITVDQCRDRVPVMCGVMDTSTRRVIDNIKRMEDLGGTCAVITPIFYARHTSQAETIRHFEQISRETNSEIVIYNIPPFTGEKIAPATVIELAKLDKVVAYKDSSGAFGEFLTVLRALKHTDISLLQGLNPYFITSMLLGADGMVPAAAPIFPEIYVEAYEAGLSGDIELCQKYEKLLVEVGKMLGMSKNITAVNKFAISTLGYTSKKVTAPQDEISPEEEQKVLAQMEVIRQKHSELKESL